MYTESEQLQQLHYDRIAVEYEAHYSDACSQQYRDRFIYEPMFEGLNLEGRRVLEAMCGSGQTTEFLLSRKALVTGLDISSREIASFKKRWPDCDIVCGSILDSTLENNSFDCITVVGGLHHLHPNLNDALREIHRVLKSGGHLCFAEPHSEALPDIVRRHWYKRDKLFADNEAAINMKELKREFSSSFSFKKELYLGNIGYLLVLNSMVFRIPLRLKPHYSPLVMWLEGVINRVQGKMFSCYVVAQWQKK